MMDSGIGTAQAMNNHGVPKGMKQMLLQRGVNVHGMMASEMKETLGSHDDFAKQLSKEELFLHSKGHAAYFLPKFHCKQNPITRVWVSLSAISRFIVSTRSRVYELIYLVV